MIISCTSCNKNFEINSDLIPDSGRLLACGSCNHQWFFTGKKIHDNTTTDIGAKETANKDNNTPDIGVIEIANKDNNTPDIGIIEIANKDNNTPDIGVIEIANKDKATPDFKTKVDLNLKNKINISDFEIKKSNKIGILRLLLIFIIFFITIIILIDTFKSPISLLMPDIEIILFNLYESLRDIMLFFKDLIR
jgi:predicted Zn finger-like uncharacterized protein